MRVSLEDYNVDFLCMLEAWEAASDFAGEPPQKIDAIEIAKLLYEARPTADQ